MMQNYYERRQIATFSQNSFFARSRLSTQNTQPSTLNPQRNCQNATAAAAATLSESTLWLMGMRTT